MQRYDPLLLIATAGVALPLLWLWAVALVDLLRRDEHDFPRLELPVRPRAFWTFVVLSMNATGAMFYYFLVVRRRPRDR